GRGSRAHAHRPAPDLGAQPQAVRAADEPEASPTDAEAAYYQTIEEYFVSRRGDPLFLSNADWNLVRKWREAGLPLRVVLRGIRDALDGHAHSFSRGQKVGSLAYFTREGETPRGRWGHARGHGGRRPRPRGAAPRPGRGGDRARRARDPRSLRPRSLRRTRARSPRR